MEEWTGRGGGAFVCVRGGCIGYREEVPSLAIHYGPLLSLLPPFPPGAWTWPASPCSSPPCCLNLLLPPFSTPAPPPSFLLFLLLPSPLLLCPSLSQSLNLASTVIWRTSNTVYQSNELAVASVAFNNATPATWDNPSTEAPEVPPLAWQTGPWVPANNSNVAFVRACLENSNLLMTSEYQVSTVYCSVYFRCTDVRMYCLRGKIYGTDVVPLVTVKAMPGCDVQMYSPHLIHTCSSPPAPCFQVLVRGSTAFQTTLTNETLPPQRPTTPYEDTVSFLTGE